jgi:hypothetical protein
MVVELARILGCKRLIQMPLTPFLRFLGNFLIFLILKMLTRKNLHRSEELFFNSILSALLRLVLKFDFATLRNSEGATVTHLTIAPS